MKSSVADAASTAPIALALGLRDPWALHEIRLGADKRSLEVHVGTAETRTDWLGRAQRKPVHGSHKQVWRHLDIAGMPTFIHASVDDARALENQSWAAPGGQAFTRAMGSHLVELLCSGMDLGVICKLHNLNLDTLWRFKIAAEHDRAALLSAGASERLKVRNAPRKRVAAAATPASGAAAVPPADSPIWRRLARGELSLETEVLGLRLLLASIRNDVLSSDDPKTREQKTAKLHRYFEKNAHQLGAELKQVNEVVA